MLETHVMALPTLHLFHACRDFRVSLLCFLCWFPFELNFTAFLPCCDSPFWRSLVGHGRPRGLGRTHSKGRYLDCHGWLLGDQRSELDHGEIFVSGAKDEFFSELQDSQSCLEVVLYLSSAGVSLNGENNGKHWMFCWSLNNTCHRNIVVDCHVLRCDHGPHGSLAIVFPGSISLTPCIEWYLSDAERDWIQLQNDLVDLCEVLWRFYHLSIATWSDGWRLTDLILSWCMLTLCWKVWLCLRCARETGDEYSSACTCACNDRCNDSNDIFGVGGHCAKLFGAFLDSWCCVWKDSKFPVGGSYGASRQHNAWQHTWFFFPFQDACETRRPFHNAATLRIYHCKRFAYHTLSGTWMQRVRITASCSQDVVSQILKRWSTTLCIGNEIILYAFICRTSESELIAPFEASIKKHTTSTYCTNFYHIFPLHKRAGGSGSCINLPPGGHFSGCSDVGPSELGKQGRHCQCRKAPLSQQMFMTDARC